MLQMMIEVLKLLRFQTQLINVKWDPIQQLNQRPFLPRSQGMDNGGENLGSDRLQIYFQEVRLVEWRLATLSMDVAWDDFPSTALSDSEELVEAPLQIKGGDPDLLAVALRNLNSEWCVLCKVHGPALTSARGERMSAHGLVCGVELR